MSELEDGKIIGLDIHMNKTKQQCRYQKSKVFHSYAVEQGIMRKYNVFAAYSYSGSARNLTDPPGGMLTFTLQILFPSSTSCEAMNIVSPMDIYG